MLDPTSRRKTKLASDLPPLERATRFLQEELSHRPVAAAHVEALAEKRGVGPALDEAKEILGVVAERLDNGRGHVVHWRRLA
jgi:hypothetical protein